MPRLLSVAIAIFCLAVGVVPARSSMLDAITREAAAPAVTPKGYDVTIVVFADYRCPYCRKFDKVLQALVAQDHKVRIVYRDWPIFGGPSVTAAREAIASQWQGKHAAFNDALFSIQGPLTLESIQSAARDAGVNAVRLATDMAAHRQEIDALLDHSDEAARSLGFGGTPGLLIGRYKVPGMLELPQLQKVVDLVRHPPAASDQGS
jgi:protein-disulfide isomerase